MALNLFQIATMGLGPGRTTLGDASFGFFGLQVNIEVRENLVYGGGIGGTGAPERKSKYYTVHVKVTYHGRSYSEYFRFSKTVGDISIKAYSAIKERVMQIRSWFTAGPLKKETQIKAYLKDKK